MNTTSAPHAPFIPLVAAAALTLAAAVVARTPREALAAPASARSRVPAVLLTAGHAKLCTVKTGDAFPAIELPALGGESTPIAKLYGKQATVVLFWTPDRWMSRAALGDLARDLKEIASGGDVAIVGVAVGQPASAVDAEVKKANAAFVELVDQSGEGLAQVGTEALPRIYVLDADGKIVWFDIEYSEATRRELAATLAALAVK